MAWIKRNLLFVAGSVVALGLLIGAGFYNFIAWQHNTDARVKLNAAYQELKRLNSGQWNPGSANVDNIGIARQQQMEVRGVFTNVTQHFKLIPPIPDSSSVGEKEFANALAETVDRLQRGAAGASVTLPPDCNFSFKAQSGRVRFETGSLKPLSEKLGEVAAICEVLFQEKINYLEGIRREKVLPDDQNGPLTDYLDRPSQTNELAVLTPYEVTFRGFSPEVAAVLSGFAGSPHGFIVTGINVEPVVPVGVPDLTGAAPAPAPAVALPGRGGLTTVLDEKALRVTLMIEVVKLLPRK